MKVRIKKISIRRFRSFGQVEIEATRLNIYSGKNNSGKSNILRALNLFFNSQSNYGVPFNYFEDYNKAFRGAAGGKREVQIEISFVGTGDGALKDGFSICRTFSEGSSSPETQYKSTNAKINAAIQARNGNITRQFTAFLNKIEYLYIPAVRDKFFIRSLLLKFEQVIKSAARGEQFDKAIDELSTILGDVSKGISLNFNTYMQMPATASLSSNVTDILGAIEINVESGLQIQDKKSSSKGHRIRNVPINLFSSGDGIVMAYLVYFLAFLTKNDKKNYIWGFEEPENSLEYSKIEDLAHQFYCEFSNQAQIFITTHSPAFINLREQDGVSLYRVYIEPHLASGGQQPSPNKRLTHVEKLETIRKQLSLLDWNDPRRTVLDDELHLAEQSRAIEEIACSVRQERERLAKEYQEFEKKNASLLNNFPDKIFVCEDDRGTELWRHLLKEARIDKVHVISSSGCCNNQVENWTVIQQHYKPEYYPKIFREIDRDGMMDRQAEVVSEYLNKKYEGVFKKYNVGVLPVCEIENFSILCNNNYEKIPGEYHQIEASRLLKIDRHFTKTIEDKLTQMLKLTGDNNEFPTIKSTSSHKKIEEMRCIATANFVQQMPGKELSKLIQNFNPVKTLMNLTYPDFPEPLRDYLAKVKDFFDDGHPSI